jgi:hypothetical protein
MLVVDRGAVRRVGASLPSSVIEAGRDGISIGIEGADV